ncbi:ribosome assembly RNA-binding protein YhbY [Thermithiobacillus plumbiphilus]|uniref:Ribosome assembly RNA-binding protein YhbY n=1 Tax=Thermithiobacillus plumbiphilus TaxID=1729899 RepID=A0ABU9DC75_9PROT
MLNSKQRQYLKGQAHSLNPVILVGDAGLSDNLLAELDRTLAHHELIKVRLPAMERNERDSLAAEIVMRSGAEMVQMIGRVLVIYRASEKQRYSLP